MEGEELPGGLGGAHELGGLEFWPEPPQVDAALAAAGPGSLAPGAGEHALQHPALLPKGEYDPTIMEGYQVRP